MLTEAGSAGISVQKLSRHVFNATNSFFHPVQLQDVHDYVLQYLHRNSRSAAGLVARTGKRGVYRLNFNNQTWRQLVLDFVEKSADEPLDEEADEAPADQSLTLF